MLQRLLDRAVLLRPDLHSEWRLIVLTAFFCSGAAFSVSNWRDTIPAFLVSLELVVVCLTLFGIYKLRRSQFVLPLFILLVTVCGALLGQYRINSLSLDHVEWREGVYSLEGRLIRLEERQNNLVRLTVAPSVLDNNGRNLPRFIKVSSRTDIEQGIRPGDLVRFTAKLNKPGGPITPSGFDFSRVSFFRGVGLEGIVLSPITKLPKDLSDNSGESFIVQTAREVIEKQILEAVPGQAGALAVALTVGYRNHLTQETTEALRQAGLSHVLAISGLHMGLVNVAAFFLFEMMFAAIPSIGLRVMPKKLAVLPTWLVAIAYLLLSGASTSTIRAFLMVSVGLLAVLTERKVLSLRSVALAACAITIYQPESVLSVGFQMSFAATAALVGFYENYRQRQTRYDAQFLQRYPGGKVLGYFLGIAGTSIIAQIAVAPFALYHFQSLSIVGVIANAVALPIVSLIVMPVLFLSILTMWLGGITLLSPILEVSLNTVLDVAIEVAGYLLSTIQVLPISDTAFLAMCLALIGLLFVRSKKAMLGLAGFLAVTFVIGQETPASVLVSRTGMVVGELRDDAIYIAGGRKNSFRNKVWRGYWGGNPQVLPKKLERYCSNNTSCSYDIGGAGRYLLTRSTDLSVIREACGRGNIVILPRRYTRYCKGAALSIPMETLSERGPVGIYFQGSEVPTLKWSQLN